MRQNEEGGQHAEEFILAHDWDKGVAMARAVAKDRPEPIPVVISLSASPCSRCSAILSARLAATRAQLTHAERDRIQFSIAARGAYEKSERIKGAEAAADKQAEREKIIQGIKDSVVKRRNFLHKRLWLGKTLNEFLDIRSEEERLKTKISHPGMAQYRGQMLPKATSTKDSDLHKLMQSGFEVQVLAVREEITESGEQLEQAIVRVRAKFQQANAV
jgi:hypothetical protein